MNDRLNQLTLLSEALQPKITVVELDATMKLISEKWFGLVETDTHKVLVGDGAEYLQTYPDTGKHSAISETA